MVYKKFKKLVAKTSYSPLVRWNRKPKSKDNLSETESSGEVVEAQPLLHRMGGARALEKVVDTFIEMVAADTVLVLFFDGVDLKHLALHQKRLLSMAFTKIPESVSVETVLKGHHQHLFAQGLSEMHFDLVAQHLVAAMKAHSVAEGHIQEAVGIVAPLRKVFEMGAKEYEQELSGSLPFALSEVPMKSA